MVQMKQFEVQMHEEGIYENFSRNLDNETGSIGKTFLYKFSE
jgi:hypothetical protein